MKTIQKTINEIILRFLAAVLSTLGILFVFGWTLDNLERIIMTRMYRSIGQGAVLVTAAVGTPLHEIAHWLGCKLFGFKVIEVELLRPVAYKTDGVLGYVKYATTGTGWWTKTGMFITGIAPMLLGCIFIILIVKIMIPEVFDSTRKSIGKRETGKSSIFLCWPLAFVGFWKGMFSLRKWGILRGIVCLYLMMSTAMHMTLSTQDLKGASIGYGVIAILYLIFAIITFCIGTNYKKHSIQTAGFIAMILSIGVISDIVLLLITIIL